MKIIPFGFYLLRNFWHYLKCFSRGRKREQPPPLESWEVKLVFSVSSASLGSGLFMPAAFLLPCEGALFAKQILHVREMNVTLHLEKYSSTCAVKALIHIDCLCSITQIYCLYSKLQHLFAQLWSVAVSCHHCWVHVQRAGGNLGCSVARLALAC